MKTEIKRIEKEFHDRQGYHYEQRWVAQPRFKHHYSRIARHIKFYLRRKNGIRLVDVGCGTGRGALFFAETHNHIVGLDISLSLLKIFRNKIRSKRLNNFDLILCDVENPPLREEIADLITFFGTLHHLPNKNKALYEATHLLQLEGIISVHEPNREAYRIPWIIGSSLSNLRTILKPKANMISTNDESEDISPYESSLTLTELKDWLLRQGLEILEAKTVWFLGIIPFKLPLAIAEFYYCVANVIDGLLEKPGLYGNKAGAVHIIAKAPSRN